MPNGQAAEQERKLAAAGTAILGGASLKQALIQQGYSPATAANPTANGIGADRCVQLATGKQSSDVIGTLRAEAAEKALANLRGDLSPAQVLKTLEVAARIGHGDQDREIPRTPAAIRERLTLIDAMMRRFRELSGRDYLETTISSGQLALSPANNAESSEKPHKQAK